MADRGLEALLMLLLVLVTASAALVPGQPPRLLGAEMLSMGGFIYMCILRLQKFYVVAVDAPFRARARRLMRMNRVAVGLMTLGGMALFLTGDLRSLYVAPVGMILTFAAAGIGAWVLLIEVNR